MSLTLLLSVPRSDRADYAQALPSALNTRGIVHRLVEEAAPETVDYIIYAPGGPLRDFGPYTNTKAVLSLWAGVESIVTNPTLTQPLCRMVDTGLKQGMIEWVTAHVLRHHLGTDAHVLNQNGEWRPVVPPLASDRTIGILGLGALGTGCARALANLGFEIHGWSRSPKSLDGITTHAGAEGLASILSISQVLVLLLPLTTLTHHILNAERLSVLPKGAFVLNAGRGRLIDDPALLAALDSGHIAHATLDVFAEEPLPREHRYWSHPKVTVTPHIASATRPETAAAAIAENIAGAEAGAPLRHVVDREAGY